MKIQANGTNRLLRPLILLVVLGAMIGCMLFLSGCSMTPAAQQEIAPLQEAKAETQAQIDEGKALVVSGEVTAEQAAALNAFIAKLEANVASIDKEIERVVKQDKEDQAQGFMELIGAVAASALGGGSVFAALMKRKPSRAADDVAELKTKSNNTEQKIEAILAGLAAVAVNDPSIKVSGVSDKLELALLGLKAFSNQLPAGPPYKGPGDQPPT